MQQGHTVDMANVYICIYLLPKSTANSINYFIRMSDTESFLASNFDMQISKEHLKKS